MAMSLRNGLIQTTAKSEIHFLCESLSQGGIDCNGGDCEFPQGDTGAVEQGNLL